MFHFYSNSNNSNNENTNYYHHNSHLLKTCMYLAMCLALYLLFNNVNATTNNIDKMITIANNIEHFLCARHVLSTLHALTHLILTTLWTSWYYPGKILLGLHNYLYLTDAKMWLLGMTPTPNNNPWSLVLTFMVFKNILPFLPFFLNPIGVTAASPSLPVPCILPLHRCLSPLPPPYFSSMAIFFIFCPLYKRQFHCVFLSPVPSSKTSSTTSIRKEEEKRKGKERLEKKIFSRQWLPVIPSNNLLSYSETFPLISLWPCGPHTLTARVWWLL